MCRKHFPFANREREREKHTVLSLTLLHSTVCCILKIRACTGNSWRCLPPLHLRPSTHSQRQKIPEPEPETETETAPSWSCRAAGTQLLLASFCCLRCCFVLADWQTACQQGETEGEGEGEKGRGKQSTVAWRDAWNCLGECSLCSIFSFLLHATNDSLVDGNGDRMCKCHKEVSTCLQQQQQRSLEMPPKRQPQRTTDIIVLRTQRILKASFQKTTHSFCRLENR